MMSMSSTGIMSTMDDNTSDTLYHRSSSDQMATTTTTATTSSNDAANNYLRYACPMCDKRFAYKSRRKAHLRCHTKERPYKCQYCGIGFTFTSARRCHERLHTGEKPHRCNICGKRFTQIGTLKGHLETHRPGKSNARVGINAELGNVTLQIPSEQRLQLQQQHRAQQEQLRIMQHHQQQQQKQQQQQQQQHQTQLIQQTSNDYVESHTSLDSLLAHSRMVALSNVLDNTQVQRNDNRKLEHQMYDNISRMLMNSTGLESTSFKASSRIDLPIRPSVICRVRSSDDGSPFVESIEPHMVFLGEKHQLEQFQKQMLNNVTSIGELQFSCALTAPLPPMYTDPPLVVPPTSTVHSNMQPRLNVPAFTSLFSMPDHPSSSGDMKSDTELPNRFELNLESTSDNQQHTADEYHQCAQCPKSFKSRSSLMAHMLTHANEPQIPCTMCTSTFRSQHALKQHLKTHERAQDKNAYKIPTSKHSQLTAELLRRLEYDKQLEYVNNDLLQRSMPSILDPTSSLWLPTSTAMYAPSSSQSTSTTNINNNIASNNGSYNALDVLLSPRNRLINQFHTSNGLSVDVMGPPDTPQLLRGRSRSQRYSMPQLSPLGLTASGQYSSASSVYPTTSIISPVASNHSPSGSVGSGAGGHASSRPPSIHDSTPSILEQMTKSILQNATNLANHQRGVAERMSNEYSP